MRKENVTIKIGVVGAGHAANKGHLPVLTKISDAEVTAICDSDTDKARKASKEFGISKVYSSYTEMLEKERLDAVDIVTSSDTHVSLAIEAMEHGCHCIMEKPLSTAATDADRAIKKANETGKGLFVTHNWSFLPGMRKARGLAASGALGEVIEVDIKYLTSFGVERYFDPNHWCHRLPGGIFADISPHLVMVLLDFLRDVKSVKAVTKKISSYPYITADELKVMVEAGNGLGSFTLSFNSPVRQFVIDITGTKMSLSLDANSQIIISHKPVSGDRPVRSFLEGIPRGLNELDKIFQQISGLSAMTVGVMLGRHHALEGHDYLIRAAIKNIRAGTAYPVDIYKCREVVRILEEAFSVVTNKGER